MIDIICPSFTSSSTLPICIDGFWLTDIKNLKDSGYLIFNHPTKRQSLASDNPFEHLFNICLIILNDKYTLASNFYDSILFYCKTEIGYRNVKDSFLIFMKANTKINLMGSFGDKFDLNENNKKLSSILEEVVESLSEEDFEQLNKKIRLEAFR